MERAVALSNPVPRSTLTHRFFDFWLLGGASLLVGAAIGVGQSLRAEYGVVENHFANLTGAFALLSLVCNYPHFMASYRMAYGRGWKFIWNHSLQMIFIPLAFLAVLAAAFVFFDEPTPAGPLALNGKVGLDLLASFTLVMYGSVGWHYSKQSFGCAMVYAKYDGYPLDASQRNWLKWALFSLVGYNFLLYNSNPNSNPEAPSTFYNVKLFSLNLPTWFTEAALWLFVGMSAMAVYRVFWINWKEKKAVPSLNFLVPIAAFVVWWLPFGRSLEYTITVVPFFHSLQYLPFVYRFENRAARESRNPELRATMIIAGLVTAGFLVFELVPSALDVALDNHVRWETWFFMIGISVFVNLHHYFLDSVIWKFDQPEIRESLF